MELSGCRLSVLFTGWLLVWTVAAGAYELRTHAEITRRASEESQGFRVYLEEIGIKPTDIFDSQNRTPREQLNNFNNTGILRDWMIEGSIREDDYQRHPVLELLGCTPAENPPSQIDRPLHHFFDVQRGGRGLMVLGSQGGFPALDWALGRQGRGSSSTQNQFSILDSRVYQLKSLTEPEKEERERNTALLFRTLGHVVHLVQDMAQPQHTRNDPHSGCVEVVGGEHSWYEDYIETRALRVRYRERSIPAPPLSLAGYTPPRFTTYQDFWTTAGEQGLADFSSRNFFSVGTNLSLFGNCGGLDEPVCDPNSDTYIPRSTPFSFQTVDGKTVSGEVTLFLRDVQDRLTGQTIPEVAVSTRSLWDQHLESRGFFPRYSMNTLNYDSISDVLLPRAVGYSAGLLDYFFRGKLDVDLLEDPIDPSIVHLEGVNASPDKLDGGTLTVYADDPVGNRTAVSPDITIVADPGQPVSSASFVAPENAERFIGVYKGKLGDETSNGDFPGGVIGKVLGGVRVEQLFTDFTRWYLRTPQGVFPLDILYPDVVELRWGDADNTLVGRSEIGPGQPNLFYSFQIKRPVGSSDVPVVDLEITVNGLPQVIQIVDMVKNPPVPFPSGINVGSTLQYSLAFDYKQYLLSFVRTETKVWNPETETYAVAGAQISDAKIDLVVNETDTTSGSIPITLNIEPAALYGWGIQEIGLSGDGRILAVVFVDIQNRIVDTATFPAFRFSIPPGADGNSVPQIIPHPDGDVTLTYQFPSGLGTTLYALVDLSNQQILASTAPPVVNINRSRAVTRFSRVSTRRVTEFRKALFVGGPQDGQFIYEASAFERNFNFCQQDQIDQMVVVEQLSVEQGDQQVTANQYRPELTQFSASGTFSNEGVSKPAFTCGEPEFGIPPQGFEITETGNGSFGSALGDAFRIRPSLGSEQLVLDVLIHGPGGSGSHTAILKWTPDQASAELRHESIDPSLEFGNILSVSQSAALRDSLIDGFDPGPKTLISLEGNLSSIILSGTEEESFVLLDPSFLYSVDDLKFYTKKPVSQRTPLPATLAAVTGFTALEDYHVVEVK